MLRPLRKLPLIPGTASGSVMALCEKASPVRGDLILPMHCPVAVLKCGRWAICSSQCVGQWCVHFQCVSRNKRQPCPAKNSGEPHPSDRKERRGGTSWSYKEIHRRSAIGKSNLLARKSLVVGKWEPVHARQLMRRILTTVWNKHFEFAFKVKLGETGETANNKKQCSEIKKVLE